VGGERSGSGETTQHEFMARVVGKCPEVTVKLGLTPTPCLLDSGAEVSTITESFYRNHLYKGQPLLDTSGWLKISAANGLAIPYIGYMEMDVEVMGYTIPRVGWLVVKDTTDPATKARKERLPGIIGCNIIGRLRGAIKERVGSDSTKFKAGGIDGTHWDQVLSLSECAAPPLASPRPDNNGRLGYVKLVGKCPVQVPARSVMVVEGSGPDGEYCALVEEVHQPDGTLPKGLAIATTFSKVQHGHLSVCVANLSSESVWIPRGSRLGVLHKADPVDDTVESSYIRTVSMSEVRLGVFEAVAGGSAASPKTQRKLEDMIDVSSELTSQQHELLAKLLHDHAGAFCLDDDDLGYTEAVKHHIPTIDDIPVRLAHRRVAPHLQQEVKDHLQKLVRQGIVRPSNSPYASQAVIVRKADNTIRLCVQCHPPRIHWFFSLLSVVWQ